MRRNTAYVFYRGGHLTSVGISQSTCWVSLPHFMVKHTRTRNDFVQHKSMCYQRRPSHSAALREQVPLFHRCNMLSIRNIMILNVHEVGCHDVMGIGGPTKV
jgi:hypothetical protein